jgi:hypothetical protein
LGQSRGNTPQCGHFGPACFAFSQMRLDFSELGGCDRAEDIQSVQLLDALVRGSHAVYPVIA